MRSLSLLLVTLLVAAGCASKKDDPSAYATAVTTLGDAPPSPSASPSKPVVLKTTPPAYPASARAYAEAVISAWKAKDLSKLGDLTTPQVQEQLIEIPGPPNMNWTFLQCDGAAGSTYCQFSNADGNKLTLRLSNATLGKAHATTEVKFQV